MIRELEVSVAKMRYEEYLRQAEHDRLVKQLPSQAAWWWVALHNLVNRLGNWNAREPQQELAGRQTTMQTQR